MKKVILSFLLTFLPMLASAEPVEIDGIWYRLDAKTKEAYVTYNPTVEWNTGSYYGEIVIPASVTYENVKYNVTGIGVQAFKNSYSLTSVTIPNSITSIGKEAFSKCKGLTSVTIPQSVINIGGSAFYQCSGLTSVTIPNSVISIGGAAFESCTGLTSINIPNSITTISSFLFCGCTNLTSVTIPQSVNKIGGDAFSWCTKLASVTFPDHAMTIFSYAFTGTPWYENQPDGIIYIGKMAYKYKGKMPNNSNITIADGTESINQYAFSNCEGLSSITIPNSVTSIDYNAFEYCRNLKSLNIPNSVTQIGGQAFELCSSLISIEIPNSVTSIGRDAFYGTPWFDNKPDGLVYAGSLAYNYKGEMPANTHVTIKDGTLGIASEAFSDCKGLTSVTIPNSVQYIGSSAFSGCTGLTTVNIPNSVQYIGSSAFKYCTGLTTITIPNSVSTIYDFAFYKCSGLSSVIISKGVTSIDSYAFSGCTSLADMYCYADKVPIVYDNGFYDLYHDNYLWGSNIATSTLHVPAESIELYRKDKPWNTFNNIIPLTDDDPKPTGLENIISSKIADNSYYDLMGQKVIPNTKGIYIHNGKIVIVKKKRYE